MSSFVKEHQTDWPNLLVIDHGVRVWSFNCLLVVSPFSATLNLMFEDNKLITLENFCLVWTFEARFWLNCKCWDFVWLSGCVELSSLRAIRVYRFSCISEWRNLVQTPNWICMKMVAVLFETTVKAILYWSYRNRNLWERIWNLQFISYVIMRRMTRRCTKSILCERDKLFF